MMPQQPYEGFLRRARSLRRLVLDASIRPDVAQTAQRTLDIPGVRRRAAEDVERRSDVALHPSLW